MIEKEVNNMHERETPMAETYGNALVDKIQDLMRNDYRIVHGSTSFSLNDPELSGAALAKAVRFVCAELRKVAK